MAGGQSSLRIDFNSRRRFAVVLGYAISSSLKRIEDNLGNNQPGILLVIGGHDIPGRVRGAGRAQAILIRLHVMLPVFPLLHIRQAEFPVFVRLINARAEAFPLFVFGQVEEEFDDLRAVTVEMLLQIHDGAVALLPNSLFVEQAHREALGRGESPDGRER